MIRIPMELRETVIAIARQAGDAIMEVYAQDFAVEIKADASPLTQADLAANRVIVEGLRRVTPDVPVLSEESAHVAWKNASTGPAIGWSTRWMARASSSSATASSASTSPDPHGRAGARVVQAPVDGRVWYAARGENAYRRDGDRDEMLHSRTPAAAPLRVAASRSHRDARTAAALERMGQIDVVAQGSSLKFCRIAEGELDVYPRFGPTSEWDTAAGQCVLHAAGGALLAAGTGKPFRYNRRDTLLNGDFIALGDPGLPWRDWLV